MEKEGQTEMDAPPLFLTLDPLFRLCGRQVQVRESVAPDIPKDAGRPALATIDLNRRITLGDSST